MKNNGKTSALTKIFKIVLCMLCAVVLVVMAYVSYVLIDYGRLDDNLSLSVEYGKENSATEKITSDKEYSVVSWNIGFGAYSSDYSFFLDGGKYSRAFSSDAVYENTNGAADLLSGIDADFAFIQEVDIDSTRSYHINQKDILTDALGYSSAVFALNYNSPYLFYPITSPHGKSVAGLLTLSSAEINSATRRSLPIETGFSKFLDLDRCYSVSKIECENGKTLCLYNVHLSAYTTDGTIATEQLEMLIGDMSAEYAKGNYVICGGDFNKDLLGNSSEIFGVDGSEFTWTQPIPEGTIPEELFTLVAASNAPSCRNANIPYEKGVSFVLTVDGFIVSNNVSVVSAETVDIAFAYSDHQPTVMKFILEQ